MKKWSICLLLVLIVFALLTGCTTEEPDQDTQKQETENQVIDFYSTDEDCFSIETKYGTLEYPEKWKGSTKTEILEEAPYTIKFFCMTSSGDVPLFDFSFGGGEGFFLGTMQNDGKHVPVYLKSCDFDRSTMSEEDYSICCAMSEDINVVISRLIEKNGLILSDNNQTIQLPEDRGEVFTVETQFGKLSYPERWKHLVTVEIVDNPIYTVKFSTKTASGEIPLFDLTFNGGDGHCLGNMKVNDQDITIYINDYTFDQSTLSDEDYLNCCAMQADVNVLLEHLTEDYGFTFG